MGKLYHQAVAIAISNCTSITIDADNNGDHNGIQETSNVNLDMDQVVDTSGPKLPPKPQDFVAVKLLPASECDDRYS